MPVYDRGGHPWITANSGGVRERGPVKKYVYLPEWYATKRFGGTKIVLRHFTEADHEDFEQMVEAWIDEGRPQHKLMPNRTDTRQPPAIISAATVHQELQLLRQEVQLLRQDIRAFMQKGRS